MDNFNFIYKYYICNQEIVVAENHKAASTSIAKSILQTYHKDIFDKLNSDTNIPFYVYHNVIPKTRDCNDKTVYAIVRNPIDRFISLVTFMKLFSLIDTVIDQLQAFKNPDSIPNFQTPHGHFALNEVFHPQIGFGLGAKNLYHIKYSDNLNDLCDKINLPKPLEVLNVSQNKLSLNTNQIDKLSEIYKEDMELYNSLI